MSAPRLTGRRVLVTGASGGLGSTAVPAAAAAGAALLLVDRDLDRLGALADDIRSGAPGALVDIASVDLTDAAEVEAFSAGPAGRVDVIWHLVGGYAGGKSVAEQPLEDWTLMHDIIVRTTLHVVRSFADALARSDFGRFILISAPAATHPTWRDGAYGAAKAGAESITLTLADDLGRPDAQGRPGRGTANIIVVPAIVNRFMRAKDPDRTWEGFVPAEDIAESLLYLTSDAAATMNGQRLRLTPAGI